MESYQKAFRVLVITFITFISSFATADDKYLKWYQEHQENYFKYMYDQQVSITSSTIEISFRWSKENLFTKGQEFELGVLMDPKQFAQPFTGNDYLSFSSKNVKTTFPCGSSDVFNYSNPDPEIKDHVYNLILKECKDVSTDIKKQAAKQIAEKYPTNVADQPANYTAISTCPEEFKKDTTYRITIYLKPVENPDGWLIKPECPDGQHHPEWGYFWINTKVQKDTVLAHVDISSNKKVDVSITDCPYLIGLTSFFGFAPGYEPNASDPVILFNRGCAPTDVIKWGMPDPLNTGWKSTGGVRCRDCDHDGLYDTDFKTSVYGTKARDCNDSCPDINVCSKPNQSCGSSNKAFCAQQCGGSGCPTDPKLINCLKPFTTCQGICQAGDLKVKICNKGLLNSQKQLCLDDCTWGDWDTCEFQKYDNCTPNQKLYLECYNDPQNYSTSVCSKDKKWVQTKACPVKTASTEELPPAVNSCNTNPVCLTGNTETKLCPDGQNLQQRNCNEFCKWTDWSNCPVVNQTCTPGTSTPCGKQCGQQTCSANGQWSDCQNQGVCLPNTNEVATCNSTGTMSHICNQNCSWEPWSECSVQIACAPGDKAVCGTFCGIQTCNAAGQWELCQESGVCQIGQTKNDPCGNNGTQQFTCNANCNWEATSICQEACECSNGPCCDGCHFHPSTLSCQEVYEYSCQGPNLGNDALRTLVTTYCSGTDQNCTGTVNTGVLEVSSDCADTQLCQSDGLSATCITPSQTCEYSASPLEACDNNPAGSGNPTICLEAKQKSGETWEWRLCKSSSTFSQNFNYELIDLNHTSVNLGGSNSGSSGITCTDWTTQDFSYIKAGDPAGIRATILSPMSCSQTGCTYYTGMITLTKTCQLAKAGQTNVASCLKNKSAAFLCKNLILTRQNRFPINKLNLIWFSHMVNFTTINNTS